MHATTNPAIAAACDRAGEDCMLVNTSQAPKSASHPPADTGAVALPAGWTLDHINKNYILQKPGEGGGVFSLEDSSARVAITAAFLRDLIAAPSVPSASLTTPSKEPAGAVAWEQAQAIKQRDYAAHHAWWDSINGDAHFDLTTRNQSAAAYAKGREDERAALAAPGAAIDAREQEVPCEICYGQTAYCPRCNPNLRRLASRPEAPPASAPAAYSDSTPNLHVGDSAFEDWYQNYRPNSVGHKQIARDAYAAGMGDPLVIAREALAPAAEVAQPVADERAEFEVWARSQGYQHDELARSKIGIVSPEYFNLNTESAYKAYQAGRIALAAENDRLREALQFYADGNHFTMHDANAWDTVSGEPSNFYEDEANTATVEDGSVAKMALASSPSSAPAESGGSRCAIGSKCENCTCAGQPPCIASGLPNEGMSLAPGAAEIMGEALRNGVRNYRNTPKGRA